MRKTITRWTIVVSFLAVLLVLMAVVVNAAQTTWYLTKDKTDYKGIYQMSTSETGTSVNSDDSALTIKKGESTVWIYLDSYESGVTEPDGIWSGTLYNNDNADKTSCTIEIGTWKIGTEKAGTFSSHGSIALLLPNKDSIKFDIKTPSSFTIDKGEYLALRITNTDDQKVSIATTSMNNEKGSIVIKNASITNPKGTIVQSLPELPAAALFGLGLAGIGAFIISKRRRGTVIAK